MEQRVYHMKYMPGMEVLESNIMDQVISKMEAYDSEKYNLSVGQKKLRRHTGPEWNR